MTYFVGQPGTRSSLDRDPMHFSHRLLGDHKNIRSVIYDVSSFAYQNNLYR